MKTNYAIDSHIHLDLYRPELRERIIHELSSSYIAAVISVSMNMNSCQTNLSLSQKYPEIHTAFGFHPEQSLPTADELDELLTWIEQHHTSMIAIGEVGLPYYLRKDASQEGRSFSITPYYEILEQFVMLAKKLNKPIILHAVHEDADLAIQLLEKHNLSSAHFHWYKGSVKTTEHMIKNGYMLSFTPDICYEKDIQKIALECPIPQMMVETDGPWPFEGPFQNEPTHPRMIHHVLAKIAKIKNSPIYTIQQQILQNTLNFYRL